MFSSPGWYDCQPGSLIIRNRIYTYLKKEQERSETKQNFLTVPAALRELEKIEMIKLWNKINKFSDIKRRQRTVPCLPSTEMVPEQYKNLTDEEKCRATVFRFGMITKKAVIYRGEDAVDGDIQYLNVENYLRSIRV